MKGRQLTHAGIGCLVCIGGILSVPCPAAAGEGPASAVSQYVEMIPTSDGSQAAGGGTPTVSTLSPTAKSALRTVDPVVKERLTEIATSSAYGAPADTRTARPSKADGSPRPTLTEASPVSTLGVVGENAPLAVGLITILGITTVAMIFAAAKGTRRDRRHTPRPSRRSPSE